MRYTTRAALIATTYLALSVNALPRPAPSYSVVNVDGATEGSASPITIIQTTTESSSSEATVTDSLIQTTTATPITSITTNVSSATTLTATTTFETTAPAVQPTMTALIPEVSMPLPTSESTSSVSSTSAGDATVTIVSVSMATPTASTSTSYYDNGMWHTTYPVKAAFTAPPVWNSTTDTGAGNGLKGRAAPSGTGYWRERRAAPSGFNAGGWNGTWH